jgi:lysozyme
VKASGYDFVMIKATEGTTIVDSYFKQNWQNAKDAGLIRSPYHFFHPNQDPVAQANFFSQTVGDLGELPMMFDWELHNGVDQATECINAHSFIQNLTDQRKPIIYSYSSYFSELGNPAWLADYPLGLAGYVPESELVIPKPWTAWTFWQYSGDNSKDSVPGIQAVPLDFDYFNGTLDDLKKWAGVV